MRLYFTLLMTVFPLSTHGNPLSPISVVCPPSLDGFPTFVPHPTDCGLYYECQDDWPILMECPGDLYFDTEYNVCNFPWLVECQTPEPGTSTAATDTTADGKCDPTSNPTLNENMETSTPFSGTVHDLPNISPSPEYETKLKNVSYVGQEQRTMWDYRVEDWIEVEAFVFTSIFSDNVEVPLEVRVNPEFGTEDNAQEQAMRYSGILGEIPLEFRARLEILDLNKGTQADGGNGGGNYHRKSMNLNTGVGEGMIEQRTIHNFFYHEGSHVSFDYLHKDKGEWICAQNDDGKFISSYARDNPAREDIAESVTAWYVITYHRDSVTKENTEIVKETIPHRLQYFTKYIHILS